MGGGAGSCEEWVVVAAMVFLLVLVRDSGGGSGGDTCAPGTVGLPPLWSDIILVSVIMMTARKVTYPFTLATRHTGVARTCEGEQAYTVLMEMWGHHRQCTRISWYGHACFCREHKCATCG